MTAGIMMATSSPGLTDLTKEMIQYGAIGILLLFCIGAIIKMYRDRAKREELFVKQITDLSEKHAEERKELRKEIQAIYVQIAEEQKRHQAEMKAFAERYITKADTWVAKHAEMTDGTVNILSAMERMFLRR